MGQTSTHSPGLIDWAVATKPLAGQPVSGDMYLVAPFDQGVLLAVIDGVGHGDEATAAAQAAAEVLNRNPAESLITLVKRCHANLAQTRGAVMTVASLDGLDDTITWLGVGNVEAQLLRAEARASHPRESVILRGGMLGCQLPALYASVIPVAAGDLLIFATDGIEPCFADAVKHDGGPQQIADRIMAHHFKGNDDALVLVAQYRGWHHE